MEDKKILWTETRGKLNLIIILYEYPDTSYTAEVWDGSTMIEDTFRYNSWSGAADEARNIADDFDAAAAVRNLSIDGVNLIEKWFKTGAQNY